MTKLICWSGIDPNPFERERVRHDVKGAEELFRLVVEPAARREHLVALPAGEERQPLRDRGILRFAERPEGTERTPELRGNPEMLDVRRVRARVERPVAIPDVI
jgi:hypothetical protein